MRKMLFFAAFSVARATLALSTSSATDLYVSPLGDDANPGTSEQPIQTLSHARDLVRSINGDMADTGG